MTLTRRLPAPTLATTGDLPDIAALVARAFSALPGARWLVPEPEHREDVLRGQFAIVMEHALQHGHADMLEDGSAVAVWFDCTRELPDPPDYDRRLRAACGRYADSFAILDSLQAGHHPQFPHDYLAFLAVDPRLQHTGRGSALLHHHHRILDEIGVPAYLEASVESNIDLYAKLGYELGEAFYLPQGPPYWPMVRATQVPGRSTQMYGVACRT